jgi:NADH-quinone oxidoreductase subunit C
VTDQTAPEAPEDAPGAGEAVVEFVHGHPTTWSGRQQVIHTSRAGYLDLLKALVDDGYEMCVDVTAVDYLGHPGRPLPPSVEPERFEVVVNVLSLSRAERLRIRVQVPESDPVVASLFDIWPGTEALEREVFDMFGIRFDGHPDLTRILMPEDWVGHPLRKDYEIGAIPVQFVAAPEARR